MAEVKVIKIDTKPAETSIKSLRQQLKELKDQMAGLEEGSQEFLDVAAAAGQVKHQIDEIQESVRGASADFGDMLSSATGALNGIVGGFTAAQGVMNLFGIESEATVEAMKKLQALMAIGQGISQIDAGIKAFNKFAAAIKTTSLNRQFLNKATKQGNTLQKENVVVTSAAAKATELWGKAMKGIGLAALLFALDLAIKGIQELIRMFNAAHSDSYKLEQALKSVNTQLEYLEKRLSVRKQVLEFESSLRSTSLTSLETVNSINKLLDSFDSYIEYGKLKVDIAKNYNIKDIGTEAVDAIDIVNGLIDAFDLLEQNSGKYPLDKYNKFFNDATESFSTISKIIGQIQKGGVVDPLQLHGLFPTVEDLRDTLVDLYKQIEKGEKNLQKIGKEDDKKDPLYQRVELLKSLATILEKLLTTETSLYKNTAKAVDLHNTTILKKLELERDSKVNAAEIYKIRIDENARENEVYAKSNKYLQDQIHYYNLLLDTQQKGSKEYEQTLADISYIKHLLKERDKEAQEGLTHLKNALGEIKVGIKSASDEADRLGDIISNRLANVDVWRWWEVWVNKVNGQFDVLIDSVSRFNESNYGLSRGWTTALSDMQVAFAGFTEIIAKDGEVSAAKWAQSFAAGAQAVGTILNTLSEEQDGNTKEGFESQKKYQIGATVFNTAAGIVNAWVSAMAPTNSYLTLPGQIALASTTTAALIALAGAQIAKIQKVTFDSNGADLSTGSIASTLVAPTQYTQAVQNANIESKLGDSRVYVVESDINQTGRRVSVQENENIY